MSAKSAVTLDSFFIYNSTYGPKEGEEHKKILYFHPPDTDLDLQTNQVGLAEAIVTFTNTFSIDKPCEAVHTQKKRQVFYEPENDFWMTMTVNVPSQKKQKDGQTQVEYHCEEVQDKVYSTILKQAYQMFTFFMGTFKNILLKSDVYTLKNKFENFFSRYLQKLKLNSADFLDITSGIQFLPLDKNTFLKIQCFINRLESTFSNISHTVFLYNDHLVWSGLEQDDIQILYKYLVTSLFPSYMELELQLGSASSAKVSSTPFSPPHYGKYISGPPNLNDPLNLGKIRKVWINGTGQRDKECHLIIYRALTASVCLLIDASSKIDFEYFKNLDCCLGPELTNLASLISEQYSKRPVSLAEPHHKFIYFNRMNLAQKSTIHIDNKKTGSINIPNDVMKLISDLHHDLSRSNDASEVIVKTMSEYWVVGKMSDQREFYVVLNQKNADIMEVNEKVKELCANQFNNIFFYE